MSFADDGTLAAGKAVGAAAVMAKRRTVQMPKNVSVDNSELTTLLKDASSPTRRLLTAWADIPLLSMLETDWERGPLVLIGLNDYMMWPLLPPGTLLQLNPKARTIAAGAWPEFERPVYLIEYKGKFYCCHAQRKGQIIILISHAESPSRPTVTIPFKEAKVRGQLTPIFRPLATRRSAAGRASHRRTNP